MSSQHGILSYPESTPLFKWLITRCNLTTTLSGLFDLIYQYFSTSVHTIRHRETPIPIVDVESVVPTIPKGDIIIVADVRMEAGFRVESSGTTQQQSAHVVYAPVGGCWVQAPIPAEDYDDYPTWKEQRRATRDTQRWAWEGDVARALQGVLES